MKASCGHCLREWDQIGNKTGHCGGSDGCHRTFGSATAFDKHQRLIDEQVHCLDPDTLGLRPVADKLGAEVWKFPPPSWGFPVQGVWGSDLVKQPWV